MVRARFPVHSWTLLTGPSQGRKAKDFWGVWILRHWCNSWRLHSQDLSTSQRPPLQTLSFWGLRFQHINLGTQRVRTLAIFQLVFLFLVLPSYNQVTQQPESSLKRYMIFAQSQNDSPSHSQQKPTVHVMAHKPTWPDLFLL